MPSTKNSLSIRLTESVVFLRTGDGTGRTRHGSQSAAPPAMVRGLLTLNLVKPMKISSVEVELVGKTSTAWPEGIGARRVEISEDHKIYSQSCVYFKAGSTPSSSHRRTLSVGPGLHLDHELDAEREHNNSDDAEHFSELGDHEERRGRHSVRGERGRPPVRHLSADQTHYHTGIVSQHNEQLPTPPYSPIHSPAMTPLHRSPVPSRAPSIITPIRHDYSPQQSQEDYWRTYPERDESSSRDPSTPGHESFTFFPPRDGSLSRRVSYDESRPDFIPGSSSGRISSQTSGARLPYSPTRIGSHDAHSPQLHDDGRGRSKGKRLSSIGMFFDAVRERVRSVSRAERDATPSHSLTRSRDARDYSPDMHESSMRRGRTREPKERSALERVTEVLGLESDEDESGDNWKEFRKGVYTYPISFTIPSSSPPTLHCDFGSVTWRLKATAHRPGKFTTKLTATQEVTVVSCPGEDDTEDTESIIVERQWDTQMQYLIMVSGRSFPIGGVIPFSITFVPWTKMKIFRLSMIIEERTEYYTDFKRLVRADPVNRVALLSLKSPHKDHPLLPLHSEDIEAFKGSTLYGDANSEEDLSEAMSQLMGSGPWSIMQNIPLAKSCNELHFTNKNKKSNITVSHTLKIIFRVQRGDDREIDPQTGKRKMFDIVVQTPIHILSCLCRPDFTALPPYSESTSTAASLLSNPPLCACSAGHTQRRTSGDTTPVDSWMHDIPFPTRGSFHWHASGSGSGSGSHTPTSLEMTHHAPSTSRPPMHRLESLLERNTRFERLMTGQESEAGEAPPTYDETVGHHQTH
ncbi:uncharacterized protein PHACADRAFT_211076 [Phanerochaete carnosa HHB-10118-sp]|uniref:Arrestin C-terminal-like domain-containing protein n=1 Tax=Phanerochaete carnosa (strain HHB-10118-sp) TaxID=650164 RepID=K5WSL1_PHACS|nr:uncharacterized protein PHACADRAFT_211076 [Phanerochaete carnosa HHB-10118-sp]EKM53377.1 hypothetical protein PHACADRAFT_211076 [Phanerochaete carnosa HHB-10118-sp]